MRVICLREEDRLEGMEGELEAGAPAVNRKSKKSGQGTSRGKKEGADPTGGSPASPCTVGL